MQTSKRTEIHVNQRMVEILSKGDYTPSLDEVFQMNYTTRGVLRNDTLKVVKIEDETYTSGPTQFLPERKTVVTKIHCEVLKNHHKQRFSVY